MSRINVLLLALLLGTATTITAQSLTSAFYKGFAAARRAARSSAAEAAQLSMSKGFTCSRPQPYTSERTLQDVLSYAMDQLTTGAIRLRIRHKPLVGVTPAMLVWLFGDGRPIVDPRDGQQYSRYLMEHPWDHFQQKWSPETLELGLSDTATQISLVEMPASGCTQQFDNVELPISCTARTQAWARKYGRGRRPPGCLPAPEALPNAPNMELYNGQITQNDVQGWKSVMPGEGPNGTVVLGSIQAWYDYVKHTGQLFITHEIIFGVVNQTGYDAATVRSANAQLISLIARNVSGNWRKLLIFNALHYIQTVGYYQKWLPATYSHNTA